MIELVKMNYRDISYLYYWVNQPEVATYTRAFAKVSRHRHLAWWCKARISRNHLVFIIWLRDRRIGITQLLKHDQYWEFRIKIFEERDRGQGFGRLATIKSIEFAHSILDADEIRLEVHKKNTAAMKLYKSIGFKTSKTSIGNSPFNEMVLRCKS
jgi:RimJ/RimL family protein N-acetyltransferase